MWHTRDLTHRYRKIFNRAWELKSMLGEIKIPWIMMSASLRCALQLDGLIGMRCAFAFHIVANTGAMKKRCFFVR
jgi:hypothetical protein